jgi:nitroimidazol reductase NimA-like FMN-containing flavoprotein (pyridoxamine 5'-phosphate oxidase superfamily)
MPTARDVYRHHPSAEEIADVLSRREVAALGTLNADGSVHLTYVLFLHEAGRVYVETSSVTRKARNVTARPRATFLVQGQASTGRNLMVSGEGDARVIVGDEALELNRRVRAKYVVPEARDALDRAWSPLDDVALELSPRAWRSWTGTVLHEVASTELGPAMPYGDIWLDDD